MSRCSGSADITENTGGSLSCKRIHYGSHPEQFYDLRLPVNLEKLEQGAFPVVVLLHGGVWTKAVGNYGYIEPNAIDLSAHGFATINIEYRCIDEGGGWTGTFDDVASALDTLPELARQQPLDLQRLILLGHSAGGQLALWAASRRGIGPHQPLFTAHPFIPKQLAAVSAISDLDGYFEQHPDYAAAIEPLLGSERDSQAFIQRLAITSPSRLTPHAGRILLVHGEADDLVPPVQTQVYAETCRRAGKYTRTLLLPGANHFNLLAINSSLWPQIRHALTELVST